MALGEFCQIIIALMAVCYYILRLYENIKKK